jgi:hypothetical protein
MDTIYQIIEWLEANWGTAVFGTLSLGTVATTIFVLFKQWVENKTQGTKYEALWNNAQTGINNVKNFYEAEKDNLSALKKETVFMHASQSVLMDAIIKMALSSKLDSSDKASIVANVERLKMMTPEEIIVDVKETIDAKKEKVSEAITNMSQELETDPIKTVTAITQNASTLLDKYTTKKE